MATFRKNFITHRAYYGASWSDVRTICGREWRVHDRFPFPESCDRFVTCLQCLVAHDPNDLETWRMGWRA